MMCTFPNVLSTAPEPRFHLSGDQLYIKENIDYKLFI